MSGLSSVESVERCEMCGADVGFLSSCIVCSTPVPTEVETDVASAASVVSATARPKLALVDAIPRSAAPPRQRVGTLGAASPDEPDTHHVHYPAELLRPGSPGWDDSFPARVEAARRARRRRQMMR